jgi:hypothetical protein
MDFCKEFNGQFQSYSFRLRLSLLRINNSLNSYPSLSNPIQPAPHTSLPVLPLPSSSPFNQIAPSPLSPKLLPLHGSSVKQQGSNSVQAKRANWALLQRGH